jgi:hypothetical protein
MHYRPFAFCLVSGWGYAASLSIVWPGTEPEESRKIEVGGSDQRRTKEAKALSTWKYMIHAGREQLSLAEFTIAVNRFQGGGYWNFELRKIFEELSSSASFR